jgi:hypothetical protein
MYLNLARLFSPTLNVLLFPGNLSILPPAEIYGSFLGRSAFDKPTIFTTATLPTFPLPPLSPVAIPSDHSMWCTERLFSTSRTADWDECLWQFWLESFGQVDLIPITGWNQEDSTLSNLVVSFQCIILSN